MSYFLVLLDESQQFVVVPESWIRDLEKIVFEKFVAEGLNSDQLHVCYYSAEEHARHVQGTPNPLFVPNFNAPRVTNFPCVNGTYLCRLLKYTCRS